MVLIKLAKSREVSFYLPFFLFLPSTSFDGFRYGFSPPLKKKKRKEKKRQQNNT